MDPITKYHQLEFRLYTDEIDIDGQCDRRFNGIDRPQVIRKARKQNNGK